MEGGREEVKGRLNFLRFALVLFTVCDRWSLGFECAKHVWLEGQLNTCVEQGRAGLS